MPAASAGKTLVAANKAFAATSGWSGSGVVISEGLPHAWVEAEDAIQGGQCEHRPRLLGGLGDAEIPTGLARGLQPTDERAEPGAVDKRGFPQIHHQAPAALLHGIGEPGSRRAGR